MTSQLLGDVTVLCVMTSWYDEASRPVFVIVVPPKRLRFSFNDGINDQTEENQHGDVSRD